MPKNKRTTIRPSREGCRQIRSEVDAVLAPLAESVGLKLKLGSMRYDDGMMTLKVEFLAIDAATGEAYSPEAEDFKLLCWRWKLSPEDLGREFSSGGNRYRIVGAKPRARKRPILCERIGSGGKRFVFEGERVRMILSVQTARNGK